MAAVDHAKLTDPVVAFSAESSPTIHPNERRRLALEQIDNAEFGWRHVRACVVAGVGFFTDAYDIFAINMASAMLGVVFWVDSNKGSVDLLLYLERLYTRQLADFKPQARFQAIPTPRSRLQPPAVPSSASLLSVGWLITSAVRRCTVWS